MNKQCMSWRKV